MSPTTKPGMTNRQRPNTDGVVAPDELSVMEPNQDAEVLGTVDALPPRQPKHSWHRAVSVGLLTVGVLAGVLLALHSVSVNKKQAALKAAQADQSLQVASQSIGLSSLGLKPISSLKQQVNTLTVNGQVDVTNSVVLEPTTQPQSAVAGQLYFDQTRNQLGYYNGGSFYYIQSSTAAGNNVSNVSNVYNVNNVSNVTNISNFTNAVTGPPGVIPMFNGSGLSDSIINESGTGVAVGATANTTTRFTITGATSDNTTSALTVTDSAGDTYAQVTDNGQVNLGKGPGAALGNTVIEPTRDTGINGIITADKFTTTNSVTVTSMSVYVGTIDTYPNNQFQLGIYKDNGGAPGAWVASSAVGTLAASTWNTLPISATLAAGTSYWLAYTTSSKSSTTDDPYYTATSSGTHAYATFTFGSGSASGMPATYPTPTTVNDVTHSIYATVIGSGSAFTLDASGAMTATGPAVFKDVNNSTAAFQVQNSSGATVLNVDSAGGNVGVGTATPSARLSVVGATSNNTSTAISVKNSNGTSLAQIGDDGQVSLGTGTGNSIGYTGVGPGQYNGSGQNMMTAQKITTTSGGTIASMTAYIGGGGIAAAPNNKFQFAIYTDNAGVPGNYLASSSVGTITAGGWLSLPLTATLAASTTYWLVYWQNDAANDSNNGLNYKTGVIGASQYYGSLAWQSGPDNGMPATFSSSGSYAGVLASIYATFSSASSALSITSAGALTQGGAATFKDPTDTNNAFQVQDSTGTTVLDVSTSDGSVGIGTTTPSNGRLSIVGATSDSTSNALSITASNGNTLAQVGDDGSVGLGETQPVFGNASSGNFTGSGYYNSGLQLLQAQSFTTTTGGAISSISTYIGQAISGTNNLYQMAIYSDVANVPNTIIASTNVGTLTNSGWTTLPITATLAANTTYWLVYWTNTIDGNHNGQNFISGYSGPNTFYQGFATWQSGGTNGMPTTFPAGSGPSGGYETSIYASYATPVAALSLNAAGNVTSNGTVSIQNSSGNALEVTDQTGGMAFNVDASNKQVAINGTNSGGFTLGVWGTVGIDGSNSANALEVTNASGQALLNADTSGLVLTVAGSTTTFATLKLNNAHFSSVQTNAPTISTPINCGTTPTATVTAGSTDSAGSFTVATGSGSGSTCDTTITFNQPYGSAPKAIILTPALGIGGATISTDARVSAASTTTFTAQLDVPAASSTYSYYYWVVQ